MRRLQLRGEEDYSSSWLGNYTCGCGRPRTHSHAAPTALMSDEMFWWMCDSSVAPAGRPEGESSRGASPHHGSSVGAVLEEAGGGPSSGGERRPSRVIGEGRGGGEEQFVSRSAP